MTKYIIASMLSLSSLAGLAQKNNTGEALCAHIANKMKTALDLSPAQQKQILVINQQLLQQKQQVRLQYPGSDSLGYRLQQVELTRDRLYKPILGEEKYQQYKQKKGELISNN